MSTTTHPDVCADSAVPAEPRSDNVVTLTRHAAALCKRVSKIEGRAAFDPEEIESWRAGLADAPTQQLRNLACELIAFALRVARETKDPGAPAIDQLTALAAELLVEAEGPDEDCQRECRAYVGGAAQVSAPRLGDAAPAGSIPLSALAPLVRPPAPRPKISATDRGRRPRLRRR